MILKNRLSLLLLLLFSSFASFAQNYEFRGVWIATVDNIDWPRKGDYDPASQRADFIRILDMHQRNGINAVVVQVRPATDAFYPSPYEPWSQWLTGKQGRPPAPYYDPLEFMITEAHNRGMEFHAWLNPYRANFSIGRASIAPNHPTRLHPNWFLNYGNTSYFDPGNVEGQAWVVNVIRDIVKRYDVDAVHMDDYFYPYKIAGKEFPDNAGYLKDPRGLNKEDWRRSNVDSIILHIATAIKETKPWVKFGISPFGVWRNSDKDPEGSPTKAGMTNYDDLYADILLWLRKGWIDYVAPQLYWENGHRLVSFDILLDWWSKHTYGRHLYIGQGIYRSLETSASSAAWRKKNELPNQINMVRANPNVQGSIFFSSKTFDSNPNGWSDTLRTNLYKVPAQIPPMDWLPKKPSELSLKQPAQTTTRS